MLAAIQLVGGGIFKLPPTSDDDSLASLAGAGDQVRAPLSRSLARRLCWPPLCPPEFWVNLNGQMRARELQPVESLFVWRRGRGRAARRPSPLTARGGQSRRAEKAGPARRAFSAGRRPAGPTAKSGGGGGHDNSIQFNSIFHCPLGRPLLGAPPKERPRNAIIVGLPQTARPGQPASTRKWRRESIGYQWAPSGVRLRANWMII